MKFLNNRKFFVIVTGLDISGPQNSWCSETNCMSKFVTTDLLLNLFTGMRFALMKVKTGLCYILSCFEVAPCKNTPVPIVFESKNLLTTTKGKMLLYFKRKKFWNKVKPRNTCSLKCWKKTLFNTLNTFLFQKAMVPPTAHTICSQTYTAVAIILST
jgi:hypothetical protein